MISSFHESTTSIYEYVYKYKVGRVSLSYTLYYSIPYVLISRHFCENRVFAGILSFRLITLYSMTKYFIASRQSRVWNSHKKDIRTRGGLDFGKWWEGTGIHHSPYIQRYKSPFSLYCGRLSFWFTL